MPRGVRKTENEAIEIVDNGLAGKDAGFNRVEDRMRNIYAELTKPFDVTFKDNRGGAEIEYITGEQCIRRLNDTLGLDGWDFEILDREITTNDEVWVRARLTAYIDGKTIIREQFGSQKIKVSRKDGKPLDIGFDLKGASTDALKKCASLMGVALYLSRKDDRPSSGTARAVSHIEPGEETIEDEDHPLWIKYQAGLAKAERLSLPLNNVSLGIKRSELANQIRTLASMIQAYENPAPESGSVA